MSKFTINIDIEIECKKLEDYYSRPDTRKLMAKQLVNKLTVDNDDLFVVARAYSANTKILEKRISV